MDETPQPPVTPPSPAPQSVVEEAIAAFDARERERAAHAKPMVTPFSLRDVDRRIWMALGVFVAFVAISLGGPPWELSFWITLAIAALVVSPFVVGAAFMWQRNR